MAKKNEVPGPRAGILCGISREHLVLKNSGIVGVLPSITVYYRPITVYYRLLPSITAYYRLLASYYRLLPSITVYCPPGPSYYRLLGGNVF